MNKERFTKLILQLNLGWQVARVHDPSEEGDKSLSRAEKEE